MTNAKEWLEFAEKFQGHKCPSLAMGLRVGAAALNALNVERCKDYELMLYADIGKDHWATDYVDGLMVATGCTVGKGNLKRTHKGKWSIVLIDKQNNKAVRISPRADIILAFRKTPFFKEYRKRGVPASKIPDEVVNPIIDLIMKTDDDDLMDISEVYDYEFKEKYRSFSSFVCEECDEVVIEEYGRVKGGRMVCIDCAKRR